MRYCLKIGLAASLALAAPALAAESGAAEGGPSPKFQLMGPSSCAGWPKSGSITSASRAVPLNWVMGYVSGWASYKDVRILDMLDPEEAATWLTDYCKENPQATLPVAARELERVLEAKLPAPAKPQEQIILPPMPKAAPPKAPAKKPPVRRKAPAAKPAPAKPATPPPAAAR